VAYTHEQFLRALSVGIVFLPLINPDGVAWDQAQDACWRKNRNPASVDPAIPVSIGIDLNRNFDIYCSFTRFFVPGGGSASDNSSSQSFHGTAAFSEPEKQDIKWVFNTFPMQFYLDLHSPSNAVLYP